MLESVSDGCVRSMPERVLFDLNVILDVIEARSPHLLYSGPALEKAYQRKIQGVVSASSIDTLAFLLQRKLSAQRVRRVIEDLLEFFKVASVSEQTIHRALDLKMKNLEDAIVYQAALDDGCDCLVTRNLRDFPSSGAKIKIIAPSAMGS